MKVERIRWALIIATMIVMGLTQWLISQGIYDPNQPLGKPQPTQQAPAPTTGSCNG